MEKCPQHVSGIKQDSEIIYITNIYREERLEGNANA